MKKNQKTYLLLGLVLAIWGVLGFKIVATVNPSSDETEPAKELGKFVPKPVKERDTFSIAANYRDPFLGTLPKKDRPKKIKSTSSKKQELPEKQILYSGLVVEKSSGNKIFFVSIDGQQRMLYQNDSFDGVKLVSGNGETIKVRYNGSTKTIPLTR